ncbi:hypothetical protein DSO57_1000274 [Entomophthora muscae]|uniref:Uncharacterized protein n=1 Tax=Entomophthora muscae TaxID=34485 RepID=A0ACC2SYL1_9FUNG|nr:hypothetical protein DSO57_1000274 [Entomophthora muscae]
MKANDCAGNMFTKPTAAVNSTARGRVGGGDLPTPGFASKSKNPGAGTIPALVAAVGPVLGPKSYTQALVGLSKLNLAAQNSQPKPTLHLECLSSQSQNSNQIEKEYMKPATKPARTNDQSGKDRPPASQATVPEDPKNDDKVANQPEEFEMPILSTQIALEEFPEAPACE